MKENQLVDLVLPNLPTQFKIPMTEIEQLAFGIGGVLTAAGVGLFVINHPLWAYGFGGVGLIILSIGIIGYLKFLAGVSKNKDNFFDFIRNAVEKETGVRMSNRTIAQMWIESPAKSHGRKFFAESRKGKEFTVKIY